MDDAHKLQIRKVPTLANLEHASDKGEANAPGAKAKCAAEDHPAANEELPPNPRVVQSHTVCNFFVF